MSKPKPTEPCPVAGCAAKRHRHHLMCFRHWRRVPRDLQQAIWAAARAMYSTGDVEAWKKLRDDAVRIVDEKEEREGRKPWQSAP